MREAAVDTYDPQQGMTPIVDGMEREQIYRAIAERVPYIVRRDGARAMDEIGINALLDQLVEIQYEEGFDDLLEPRIEDYIEEEIPLQ